MKRGGPLKRNTPLRSGKPLERGAPLKRGKPLASSSGLGGSGGPLKRSPLKQRSSKRSEFMREVRAPAVARMVAEGEPCRIGPILDSEGVTPNPCTGKVQGLHERRKRSAGGSLVNRANLLPACNACNGWIEDHPAEARDRFGPVLVVREGDFEWDLLGARSDRFME